MAADAQDHVGRRSRAAERVRLHDVELDRRRRRQSERDVCCVAESVSVGADRRHQRPITLERRRAVGDVHAEQAGRRQPVGRRGGRSEDERCDREHDEAAHPAPSTRGGGRGIGAAYPHRTFTFRSIAGHDTCRYSDYMRRTVVFGAVIAALAVPALAVGAGLAIGDGTLVVKNGTAPKGTPVITLVIRGAAIGQISGFGKIVIDDPTQNDGASPEVTGATWHRDSGDTATTWGGADFRFRVVGGVYKITIYGSGVDLVASGRGNAILAGSTDTPSRDGVYSVNGGDFHSLPAVPTKQLTIGAPTSTTG